jgi:autophagy-related protein 13
MPGYNDADEGSGDSGVIQPGGPSKDAVKKLDQIIQVWQFPLQVSKALV